MDEVLYLTKEESLSLTSEAERDVKCNNSSKRKTTLRYQNKLKSSTFDGTTGVLILF